MDICHAILSSIARLVILHKFTFFPLFFLGRLQPGGAAWWLQTRETAASSPTPPPSTCPLQKGEVGPLSAQTGRRRRRRRRKTIAGGSCDFPWLSHKKRKGVSEQRLPAQTVTSEKVGGAGVGVGGERVGQQACSRNRVAVPLHQKWVEDLFQYRG